MAAEPHSSLLEKAFSATFERCYISQQLVDCLVLRIFRGNASFCIAYNCHKPELYDCRWQHCAQADLQRIMSLSTHAVQLHSFRCRHNSCHVVSLCTAAYCARAYLFVHHNNITKDSSDCTSNACCLLSVP